MDYKKIQEEFWEKARAIGYIRSEEYCIAVGKDTLGAEDVILGSFRVSTEEEWEIKSKEILKSHYSIEEDEDLNIYGVYVGEGEYVLEEWTEPLIYRIDEKSLQKITEEYKIKKLKGEIRE